jgi:uncharacterized protein
VTWLLLFASGLWAGIQNALAGGGSFITLPALMFSGLDARAANITSAVALLPGQLVAGMRGSRMATGLGTLTLPHMVLISLAGGGLGAVLILITPASTFANMVPWLVLVATGLFAWGSFGPKQLQIHLGARSTTLGLFTSSVYGGFFGGGNSIILLALLTLGGMAVRTASAAKNMLTAAINVAAVGVFMLSPAVDASKAVGVGLGALAGSWIGAHLLPYINEKLLRVFVIVVGLALAVGLSLT